MPAKDSFEQVMRRWIRCRDCNSLIEIGLYDYLNKSSGFCHVCGKYAKHGLADLLTKEDILPRSSV